MIALTRPDLVEAYRNAPETGMGYCVVSVVLRDGTRHDQVVINSGYIAQMRGQIALSFTEEEIDHFVVTHDKWNFRAE